MREIKFRVRGKASYTDEKEQMIYFGKPFIDCEYNRLSMSCDWEKYKIQHGDMQIDKPAIMQYTGLKDKNGVEIYEGDIFTVRLPGMPHDMRSTQVVQYKGGVFHSGDYPIYLMSKDTIEIKGNIYENPELLHL